MFTGIVSGLGTVTKIEAKPDERVFAISTPYDDAVLGESIAVNGVCLTVAGIAREGVFTFFVSRETCHRTILGELTTGARVNLERALRLTDRLSGHLVQGHVDGVGKLTAIRQASDSHELEIELAPEYLKYVIE